MFWCRRELSHHHRRLDAGSRKRVRRRWRCAVSPGSTILGHCIHVSERGAAKLRGHILTAVKACCDPAIVLTKTGQLEIHLHHRAGLDRISSRSRCLSFRQGRHYRRPRTSALDSMAELLSNTWKLPRHRVRIHLSPERELTSPFSLGIALT